MRLGKLKQFAYAFERSNVCFFCFFFSVIHGKLLQGALSASFTNILNQSYNATHKCLDFSMNLR